MKTAMNLYATSPSLYEKMEMIAKVLGSYNKGQK